jgi:predicted enzyme related to lactoylglutathione lyase
MQLSIETERWKIKSAVNGISPHCCYRKNSVEEAKANPNPWIVIMDRTPDDVKEVPHLILYVTDMKAAVVAIKAAGGTVEGESRAFSGTGMIVGFAADPAGNRMVLIRQKAK